MLPRNDSDVMAHATGGSSDASLLFKFRSANPQLIPVEWDGRGAFCQQYWHLAFLDHREHSSGIEPECCHVSMTDSCIYDHSELWQDRTTRDLVHIAHPYCDGEDSGFRQGRDFLRQRGLNSAMSSDSWYYPEHSNLVVVARPRTFDRIVLDNVLHMADFNCERDVERIVVAKKATEQFDADQWFAEAEKEEANGNYYRAALLFIDTAHTERTGRFHRRAVRCLRRAGALLRDHYEDTVLLIAKRSYLTRREVRIVFQFAGIAVPDWLERIWLNGRRSDAWKHRWDVRGDDGELNDFHRCVVCEEWAISSESVSTNLGHMHSDRDCLARVAGVPVSSGLPRSGE